MLEWGIYKEYKLAMLEIHEMPGHLIRRLNQASVSLFLQETSQAGYDITPVQYGALAAIENLPGLDQVTLASNIAYDRVTIGGVVDRLVKKDLVRRQVNAKDRRSKELHLTENGENALTSLRPIVQKIQLILLYGLDEEESKNFIRLLKKITDATNDQSRAPLKV